MLLCSPLLLYLGAVLYVELGFVTPKLASSLSKLFEAKVDVGEVRTSWLRDLNIEHVAVQSADKSEPLKLGSVKLDFDSMKLWGENRIRLATIEKPQFDFRRNEAGQWNIGLHLPEEKGPGYRIEQTVVRDGDFSIALGPQSQALKLTGLTGNFTDSGPHAPAAFLMRGLFESLDAISATGTTGPGAAFSARVFGGVNLERDLAGILGAGPTGHIAFDLGGMRESLPKNAERGGPVTFGFQFDLDRFRYPIATNWAVVAPNRRLDLDGKVDVEGTGEATAALRDIELRIEGLGQLRGSGRVLKTPGSHLSLEHVTGRIDMATLNELFEPHLMPGSVKVQGSLDVAELFYLIPMASGAPASTFSAKLASTGARVAFSTLGELPGCDIAGTLNWPALNGATLSLGELGRIAFDMKDMSPSDPHFFLAMADGTQIHDLRLDINRFWESEVGRRVLTSNFDLKQPVIAVADMPYIFKGQIIGTDMHLAVSPSVAKPEQLVLNGLKMTDCVIAKWPLPFKIPGKKFSGEMNLDAAMKGELVERLTLHGKLSETGPAGPAQARVEFEHTFFPTAAPEQRVGPIKIKHLAMALADLDQMFEIKRLTGVSGTGILQMSDASLYLQRMSAEAALSLDNCELQIEVTPGIHAALVSALKSSDHAVIATALENYPLETIKLANLSAKFQVTIEGNRISLKGRTEALPIRIKMPSGVPLVSFIGSGDYTAYTLPPADVSLEVELDEKNAPKAYRAQVALTDKTRLALTLHPPLDIHDKTKSFWTATGSLEAAAGGGLSLSFIVPIDPLRRQVGDVALGIKDLDLAMFGPLAKAEGISELSGRLTDVDLRVRPFSYAMPSIEKLANFELNGTLANVGFKDALAEFSHVGGKLRCVMTSAGESISVNSLLKLNSYEALLNSMYKIPPPENGHGGILQVAGTLTRKDGISQFVLSKGDLSLANETQISAPGTIEFSGMEVRGVNLSPLRIVVPDTAKAIDAFSPADARAQVPWKDDAGISGLGTFEGAFTRDARGKMELNGKLGIRKNLLSKNDYPLLWRWNAGTADAPKK